MTSNLVQRLRAAAHPRFSSYAIAQLLAEAADEIERLSKELDDFALFVNGYGE